MSASSCTRFDGCDCPLCPLDVQSLGYGVWFADESVCPRKDFAALPWVRRQRKLARVLGPLSSAGSFTVRMLERDFIVRRGLTGLDPNKGPPDRTEADWLGVHPERLASTEAGRAAMRARAEKSGALRPGRKSPGGAQSRAPVILVAETASGQGGGQ